MSLFEPNVAADRDALGARLIGEVDRCARYFRPLSIIRFDYHGLGLDIPDDALPADGLGDVAGILRPSDTVASLGEGRFCVLVPETSVEVARLIAARIWQWAEGRREASTGLLGTLSLSFGIAGFEGQDDTAADILARAGNALVHAAGQGGNRVAALTRGGIMTMTGLDSAA